MQRFAAALVAVCVLAPATARADVDDSALDAVLGGEIAVTLRSGTEAKGRLVSFTRESIKIDDASVARSDVVALRLVSAPPIDENALRAAMGARVVVRLRDGREISGKLLAFTPKALTLVGDDSIVRTVPRGELRALRHRALGRKFGIELGMLPGIMADADIGLFRAYVSGAFFFPAVTSGNIWGFSAGAGVGIPISPSMPALKIDVLAHANLLGVGSSCSVCGYPTAHTVAIGFAVGVHTTLDSGFTIGVMVPVIGWSATPDYHGTTNTAVSYYFISSGVSMAIGYMGYRF